MLRFVAILSLIFCLMPKLAFSQLELPSDKPIRFGRMPSISPDGTKVCFSYQGNLWVSSISGGSATRLTATDSTDINPHWSADGKWIAFNSDRDGGSKIFVIPAVGGPAKQLSFHSAPLTVADWYPDGKAILVTTIRNTDFAAIYKMEIPSGRLKLLFNDAAKAIFPTLSPDGKWIAWTRGLLADVIRKNYKGAAHYDIYTAPADFSKTPRKLSDSDKNNMWPVWNKESSMVYYCSERSGVMTVWRVPRDGGKPTQIVTNPPDAIRYLSSARNANTLVYECDNKIGTTSANGGAFQDISVICRTDDKGKLKTNTTYAGTNAAEYALSPDGKKVALVVRGDIFLANTEKPNEAKRLTNTPLREQHVRWSPDGKNIVFESNRTGANKIYAINIATKETTQITKMAGIDSFPTYSPDGNWIAFLRGPKTSVYVVKSDGSGEQLLVKGPKIEMLRWSPDGKWISYAQENDIRVEDAFVARVTLKDGVMTAAEPVNVTDHPGLNDEPRWYPDGSKLAYRSNRYRNRDVETLNHTGKFNVYSTSLEKDKDKFDDDEDAPKPAEAKPGDKKPEPKIDVKVDPSEIERRGKSIIAPETSVESYEISPDGKSIAFVAANDGKVDLWVAGAEGGSPQRLTQSGEAPTSLSWTSDSSKIYYLSGGSVKWIAKTGAGAGQVAFTVRMDIDRLVDFKAVFDEAWNTLNDNYYDPDFHGVNWKAVGDKYRSLIDSTSVRSDLDYLINQMLGELNSSHMGFVNIAAVRPSRQTGMLGVIPDPEFKGDGVKVGEIVPRSPADKNESRLKVGEYVLTVDDTTVTDEASFDQALADKAGRTVVLMVNSKPTLDGAHKVKIKPILLQAYRLLVYEKWVDGRRAIVDKVSNGKVGYLHVTDMGDAARNRFERELFSIGMRKEAVIVDVRYNQGGDTHDSLLRMVERNKHYFTFVWRNETPFTQPERAITKPVILLTNPGSLSDAECFANGWRELNIGKIVGQPTMGWIIFTSSRLLLDGSMIRVPGLGCFTNSGRDMENWGVPPDVLVDMTPEDAMNGKDPQIEKAVEEVLKDKRIKK